MAWHIRSKTNTSTMDNVLHTWKWNTRTVQVYMEPPLIPLMKKKNNEKLGKYCVKIKFRSDPISQHFDLYESQWTCLITAISRSSCCSSGISIWLSKCQEGSCMAQKFNTFVSRYLEKRYIRLTRCLIRLELIPQKTWCSFVLVWFRTLFLLMRFQTKSAQCAAGWGIRVG